MSTASELSNVIADLQRPELPPAMLAALAASREARDIRLSELVDRLNERFGTDFKPADQLFFDQITETAVANNQLREAAKVNTLENFGYVFDKMLEGLFLQRMEGNEEIFVKLMNDDSFRDLAAKHLKRDVYNKIRQEA